MRVSLFLFLSIGILFASCTDNDDEVNAVNIRIRNLSDIPFDEVQVGDQEILYTDIAPDSYSDYLEYETAYRYAYIAITAGEESYVLQPVDYVGETALPLGLYTYELDITAEGAVELNFVAD